MSAILQLGQTESQGLAHGKKSTSMFQVRFMFVALCYITIAAVSVLDLWFAVANTYIANDEWNPVCLALIELEPRGLTFFTVGKLLGTVSVLSVLLTLQRYAYKYANLVTVVITVFQVGLLVHLTLSDPLMYHLPNFGLLFDGDAESIWELSWCVNR